MTDTEQGSLHTNAKEADQEREDTKVSHEVRTALLKTDLIYSKGV
jgi:hypothetical protein